MLPLVYFYFLCLYVIFISLGIDLTLTLFALCYIEDTKEQSS